MSKADGQFICIKFDRELIGDISLIGNEQAFTVTGQEYKFVPGGDLETKTYEVVNVFAHTTEENTIVLEFEHDRFESSIGNITIAYDSTKGNLRGNGGPVEEFTVQFFPTDLIWKGHQNDAEHITMSATVEANLMRIYYSNFKTADEHITITASVNATLTSVDDI